MVRPTYVDGNGMKKGAWSEEEDNKLRAYIERYGHWNWRLLPKFAGLARCGKSCRLRWVNYLKPGTKHGNFSKHEEDLIVQLHNRLGNRWSAIATEMPGRTDNEIKNFWHAHVKKRHGKPDVHAMQPESMIKENANGKSDQVLLFDEEEQSPNPSNSINTTPHVLDESNHLDFSDVNVLLPHDSNSWGYVAQSSDNLSADLNSPASVAQSSYNLWADSNSLDLWQDNQVSVFDEDVQFPFPSNHINSAPQIAAASNDLDFSNINVLHYSNSPVSVTQHSDNSWPELYLDDTSCNQNVYYNFHDLLEEEISNSGFIQEHHYGEDDLSIFDYSIPASFDWNQTDDVLDTSQSELTYNFASQMEVGGDVYDHCFQYFDNDTDM